MRRVICALLTILLASMLGAGRTLAVPDEVAPKGKVVAGAPGRIEGSDEPIYVGASTTGIVEKVAVHQGDLVSKGELLVQVECSDVKAQLAARIADYKATGAYYRKLINGARPEEITRRSSTLLSSNSGSQATRDTDERDFLMAAAQVNAARYQLELLKAGTREEELTEARNKMFAAQNTVGATKADLAKCEVRSPIDGIVLRKEVSVGELVSVYYPKPVLVLSKIDRYRVRAEVDEHDVTKIRLGQHVVVVINGSPQIRMDGKVSEIAPVMGRRKILTSDPADKSDRDVVEVVVDLDKKPRLLPIGLRVSVIFLR
jgi:HlyD family secretion protein